MTEISQAARDTLLAGLDCLRVGVVVFDGDEKLVYCNEHFRYIFRAFDTVGTLQGMTYEALLRLLLDNGEIAGEDALEDPHDWIETRLALHRSRDYQPRVERLADGRWIEVKSRPIGDGAAGGINGSIILWNDITSLMRTQMRLEAAIQSSADGFAVWDQADRLVMHNHVFARLHRATRDKVAAGTSFRDFIAGVARSGIFDMPSGDTEWISQRMEKHVLPIGQSTLHHRDGRWFLLRDRRTREGGRVTVYTDITELKERERQLIERGKTLQHTLHELEMNQAMLEDQASNLVDVAEKLDHAKSAAERANESKTSFLRNMSHELRTPLNSIIGFSEVLEKELFGPLGNEQYLDYAGMIHSSGGHLLTLINQILDLSKIEAGRYELAREVFDLREVAEDCAAMVNSQVVAGHLTLEVILPGHPVDIDADMTAVRQVVINGLSNAVKFTNEGGSVILRLEEDGGAFARLSISDTGIGISPNDLKRVMIPFEQVDDGFASSKRGTGLGLPIVKSLVELHGGHVEIASTLGRGTTLTVWLPRKASPAVGKREATYGLLATPEQRR